MRTDTSTRIGRANTSDGQMISGNLRTGDPGETFTLNLRRTGGTDQAPTYRGELAAQQARKVEAGTGSAIPDETRFGRIAIRVKFPSRTIELWPLSNSTYEVWQMPAPAQAAGKAARTPSPAQAVGYKAKPAPRPVDPLEQMTGALVDAALAVRRISRTNAKGRDARAAKIDQLLAARRGVNAVLQQIDADIDAERANAFLPGKD
jgi:hypothetical protein